MHFATVSFESCRLLSCSDFKSRRKQDVILQKVLTSCQLRLVRVDTGAQHFLREPPLLWRIKHAGSDRKSFHGEIMLNQPGPVDQHQQMVNYGSEDYIMCCHTPTAPFFLKCKDLRMLHKYTTPSVSQKGMVHLSSPM